MRINYYDDPRSPGSGQAPQAMPWSAPSREPSPAPEIPARQGKKKRGQRLTKKKKSGLPRFLVWLFLLAALTGGVVWLNGGVKPLGLDLGQLEEMLPQLPYPWESEAPGQSDRPSLPDLPDDDYGDGDSGWDRDWTADLANTAIEAAPTGDGTTLTLTGPGQALDPADLYEKVNPAIVGVRVMAEDMIAAGSGVILSSDGYIVTNAHVIAGGKLVDVLLYNNQRLPAKLVGYDKETDLAVLKLQVRHLPVAEFGDSEALRVGERVYAIGNPLGEQFRGTMTDGIVSAVDRSVSSWNGDMTLIQTTAPLNSGNSGGALCNAAGQVVGITNMKMMDSEETIEGMGFAIPSASVKTVVDQIIQLGYFKGWPMLGITVANHYDDDGNPDGAEVISVMERSSAWEVGVRKGFVIIEANGVPVRTIDDLLGAKKGLQVGDTLSLLARTRGDKVLPFDVVLKSTREMEE